MAGLADSSGGFDISRSARTEADGMAAVPAGDGVTLIMLQADPAGGICYSVEGGRPRMLQIGEEIADSRLGIIDTARFVVLMDPAQQRLRALCTLFGGARVYLFGAKWGTWLDESGTINRSPDMVHRMKSHRVPVSFDVQGTEIILEINVNPHFRAAFTQDTISGFDFRANSHVVQMSFDVPSGKFKRAKLLIQGKRGHDASSTSMGVRGFPFVWPALGEEPKPVSPSRSNPVPVRPAPPPVQASPVPSPPPGVSTGGEAPRMKLAPRQAPANAPSDSTETGRIRLKPRGADSKSQDPPRRATISPAGSSADSNPPRSATPPPDGFRFADTGPSRVRLRPLGSDSLGGGHALAGNRPPTDARERDSMPPSEPVGGADGWIDDLLATDSESVGGGPTPSSSPTPEASPRVKAPVEGMQAVKKGVLTIPIQQLPIEQLVERIEAEGNSETRWKMIEQNLILGREERTYQLVSRYFEDIHERTPGWPPARLKLAFGRIPGGILFGIMHGWKVNQVMAVAEENPESEKIMVWLRERELDRMLQLDTSVEITTVEAARRELCVDKNADETAVKKTWRTLLGFLNADHGRQDERAIHRKKDEIAKHLQSARNVILRLK